MKKRLLSCLMVLALTCSLLPASVRAEEVKTEPSVPAAMETQLAQEQKTEPAEEEKEPEQAEPEETKESEQLEETEEPQEPQPAEEAEEENRAAPAEEPAAESTVQAAENEGQPAALDAAKIGMTSYDTLDAAVAAVKDGEAIELLNDCELTVGTIEKNVTIRGGGKTITVPTQPTNEGKLIVKNSKLTFDHVTVHFGNTKDWSLVLIGDASVLNLLNGTICTFENHGIYVQAVTAAINVDASKLILHDMAYTAMMGEHAAADGVSEPSTHDPVTNLLNITNGATLRIYDLKPGEGGAGEANGLNWFKVKVADSRLDVTGCMKQGLVACELTLDNANAIISDNGELGMTAYSGNALMMKNNSVLTMENNGECGIWASGASTLNIEAGSKLTIRGTGHSLNSPQDKSYYAAIGIAKTTGSATFEDGAEVNLIDNQVSAIYNKGTVTLGDGTVVTGNGREAMKAVHGGGIDNHGVIIVSKNAEVCNNHAVIAGDDIYNAEEAAITFGTVGFGWVLDDCDHSIDSWYYDEAENRWSAHEKPLRTDACSTGGETVEGALALKAAHGLIPIEPDEPDAPFHSKSKTATNLDENYQSDVTLSLPAKEESLTSDVVFVLDKSTSAALEEQALAMLRNLQEQIRLVGGKVKVGVVIFNKEAHATGLLDLETQYADIEAAVKQELKSGTNTHAGLLTGKALLDEDTDVDASRKYLIFVSDGITYMYGAEPTATAWTFNADGFKSWAGPDNWASKYGTSEPPEDWNAWLADIGEKVAKQGTDYEYPYGGTAAAATPEENWQTAYATSVDKALYLTHEAYQDARSAGYHCYAMTATQNEGTQHVWGPSFMDYLAGGEEISFEGIGHDILYLLSASSRVEDYLGYTGDYNFDLVLPEGQCPFRVTVTGADGTKTVYTARAEGENTWMFFSEEQDGPAFTVTYHPGEKKGDEYFTWTFHQSITNFQRVELTYTVKLTNPKTTSGTYGKFDADGSEKYDGLYTNNSATLYPVDSNNDSGLPESFGKPTVSYTVRGGSSGGGGGGGEKLNTEDHYSYIIGYKDGYLRPYGNISRGEVATIFFRMLTDKTRNDYWSQTNPYADVMAEKWCNNAISTLHHMNIIDGYADGTFQPDGPITRAAFTKMAVNFFDYHVKAYDGKFSDVDGDAWYAGYIQAAAELKLIEGFADGTFRPDDYITRAQACTIINRTLGRVPDAGHMNIRPLVTWPDCDEDAWYYAAMMEATNSHDYRWITVNKEKTEEWTEKLPQRDWAALEHTWSTAHSAKGGEVVG